MTTNNENENEFEMPDESNLTREVQEGINLPDDGNDESKLPDGNDLTRDVQAGIDLPESENDDNQLPGGNDLTRDVQAGIDLPPSQRSSKGSIISQFNNMPKGIKVMSMVALAIVLLGSITFLFSDETKTEPKSNTISSDDEFRNQTERFGLKKELKETFIPKEDRTVLPPDIEASMQPPRPTTAQAPKSKTAQKLNDLQPAGAPQHQNPLKSHISKKSASNKKFNMSPDYQLSPLLQQRMSENYQRAMSFYSSPQLVYTSGDNGTTGNPDLKKTVDKEYQNLYEGADKVSKGHQFYMAAGSEMRAVLDEPIDTDYPSIVRATVIYPSELSGSKVLISYNLGNERVSASVLKLILPDKGLGRPKEMTIDAVVRDGLPGIGGDVNHHWMPQIMAGIANAGIAGGALYYASKQGPSDNLGAALIAQPMIEKGTEGLMRPIDHFGRRRAVTVKADAGQEFAVILITGFEVML